MRGLFVSIAAVILPALAAAQDVYFLGEIHDNPAHHQTQADEVRRIAPTAVVFEMLTPAAAAAVNALSDRTPEAIAKVTQWDQSGWPDFAFYAPIFAAAAEAQIYGANVPRDEIRQVMKGDMAQSFGPEAAEFGLTDRLPEAQAHERETEQQEAHCGALPSEMLPIMVNAQRYRDAVIARAAATALAAHGAPVVVITGNGHARTDYGAPAALLHARPDIKVYSLGQFEEKPTGEIPFDDWRVADAPERPDPCAAFK